MVIGKYPKTGGNFLEAKAGKHGQVAIGLQDREASTFVDGVYLKLG